LETVSDLQGDPFREMVEVPNTHHCSQEESPL
jgi:hypothetical protein